jgi:hypothetical protein
MTHSAIEPVYSVSEQARRLRGELQAARQALVEAETELAQEQAAVNAFRMHCRLKLDDLVENLLALSAEKEAYLTRWQLLRQAESDGAIPAADSFWPTDAPPDEAEEIVLLPTQTPHDKAAEKRLYRELARRFHPDLAGTSVERAYSTAMMAAVNLAYEARDLQALYDLAGELDPAAIAELAGIETAEIRRLREQILKCGRRRRKVIQQLKALREENTARLWRKAQALAVDGDNWWDLVRRELEQAIAQRQQQLDWLKAQVESGS